MALGIDLARYATDVRRLTLSRWRGPATMLDPEELVQEVYLAILRRNALPCAFDPSRGTLGTYVYRVAGSVIANMLEARRRARRELPGDPELFEEMADERDPAAAVGLAEAALEAGVDLEASREAGELLTRPRRALWERALAERTAPGQLALLDAAAMLGPEAPPEAPPAAPAPRPRGPRREKATPRQGSLPGF